MRRIEDVNIAEQEMPVAAETPAVDKEVRQQQEDLKNWNNARRIETVPARNNRQAVIDSFKGGSPLAFITNVEDRQWLEQHIDTFGYANPDEEKKRLAVAAYCAQTFNTDANFVRFNFDECMEKFFGEKMSVDRAYREIARMVNGGKLPKGDYKAEEYLSALAAGGVELAADIAGAVYQAGSLDWKLRKKMIEPLLPQAAVKYLDEQFAKRDKLALNWIYKGNKEVAESLDLDSHVSGDLVSRLLENNWEDFSAEDFLKSFVRSIPAQGVQILVAGLAPYALPAYIGATTAGRKSFEVEENNPEWNELKKGSYIALSAANEALFDLVTGKILRGGKGSKEAAAKAISRGLFKYIGLSALEEGGTESLQQIFDNVLGILYNVDGDSASLSGKELLGRVFSGVPESMLLGGIWGGIFGGIGYKSGRNYMETLEAVRSKHQNRIDTLEAKENLTPEEAVQLKNSRDILDCDDQHMIAADYVADCVEQLNSDLEVFASSEFAETMEEAADGIESETAAAAVKAQRKLAVRSGLNWDINDSVREAQRISQLFPEWEIEIFESASAIPAELRQQIEAQGMTPERARAFIGKDNKVYMVADRVPPSEVGKTLGHEIIGHRGIRAVFGEDYDSLLDWVYSTHAEEINSYAARYRRNPENNIDNQRYLTEEFLADHADLDEKPAWWKEFIARIRMWLREKFPSLKFTDRDIEGVISMANRRIRKGGMVDNGQEIRASIIGEYGASRLNEAETLTADLATAKTMLAAGKDARTVKLATGWELGGDGKWRMEIPDLEFKKDNFTAPVSLNGHLQDFVDAPELFAAYPDLRGMIVLTTDNLPENVAARHIVDLSGDAIFFNRKYFGTTPDQQDRLNRAAKNIDRSYNWTEKDTKVAQMLRLETNPETLRKEAYAAKEQVRDEQLDKIRRTLIHEIQHAIQSEEGFAEGSSTQHFKEFPVKNKELYKALESAMQTEYEIRKQLAEYPDAYRNAQRYFELDDVYFSDAQIDEQGILDEMDRLDDEIRSAGIAELWDKYQIAVRERRAAQLKYDNSALTPLEAYKRTAGEVEARNATARADMPMDERRQTLLADTEDVAEEDKIYLESLWNDGVADMAEPFTAQQKRALLGLSGAGNVLRSILYGGSLTKNGNTVNFDGRNSHALKLHLDAPGMKPLKGFVTVEEVEKYLPLALAQKPKNDSKRNKRNRKKTNKKYQITDNNVRYTLTTSLKGDFRSFYSNKKTPSEVNSQKAGYASSSELTNTIQQKTENANNLRFSVDVTDGNGLERTLTDGRDLRFLLSEYSEEEHDLIVAVLKPFVGFNLNRTDEEYQEYLRKKGVAVSKGDAHAFAVTAMRSNITDYNQRNAAKRKAAREKSVAARDEWLYANIPLYREAIDFAGSKDFKIKPSARFRGEEFSGTFIAPEFAAYARSKKKDAAKLDSAQGVNSDEFAESLARKWGRDAVELEQEIIDYFRDLKKPDLYKEYSEYKRDQVLSSKEEDRIAEEEYLKNTQSRIEDEVIYILKNGLPLTEEFLEKNPEVYRELHKQIFKEEAPAKPRKKDIEALNAAVQNEKGNAETFAAAYRTAREAAGKEYMQKLNDLREKVMQSKADAMNLQKEAWDLARLRLPVEEQSAFVRSILDLMKLSTSKTNKHPEGERMTAFRNLINKINMRSNMMRRNNAYTEIMELLDSAKTGRTYKGEVFSKLPEVQQDVDNIRKMIAMNAPAVASKIDANNERIVELDALEDAYDEIDKLILENRLLAIFGDLGNADTARTEYALTLLRDLITRGKERYKDKLHDRLDRINGMRSKALTEITKGERTLLDEVDNKDAHTNFMLKNAGLASLMRLASGVDNNRFDQSVAGEIYSKIEDASYAEATDLRTLQDEFEDAIAKVTGNEKNSDAARWRARGKFIREVTTVEKNSGVFIREYTRTQQFDENHPAFEEKGRRQLKKVLIPIEDYSDRGKTKPGVRSILQKIDNGEEVDSVKGLALSDMSIHFLRQQLADYDAGVEHIYEVFGNPADDASIDSLIKEGRKEHKLMLIATEHDEKYQMKELELSRAAALQILLTWEQDDYRDNLRWNGWDDNSIEQLKEFIGEDLLELGYWMRSKIKENSAKLDTKVFEDYGAHLPENENYWPGVFNSIRGKSLEQLRKKNSLDTSFLIARKFHLNPVDTTIDALSVFMQNQMQQAHYLNWSDAVRELKAVYGNSKIRQAITNQYGSNVYNNLMERVSVIINGGGSSEYAVKILQQAFKYWIPAKIALNAGSMLKQVAGTVAYANNMPLGDFVKYLTSANFSNPQYKAFYEWAMRSDYMKNRQAGGMDKDFMYIANMAKDSREYSPWADALLRWGTWGTRKADQISTLTGGFAIYQSTYDKAVASGMDKTEALKAARKAWMRSTDETQQSGFLKDQNYFQSNQGAFRYLTAFMSNPIQIMNLEWQTINDIRSGNKDAWTKLRRQILVNHLIVPTMMLFINDLLRRGLDPDDWEDFEIEDYFAAWIAGPWEGAFFLGKIGMNSANYLMDTAIGRKFKFNTNTISAVPLFDEALADTQFLLRISEKDNWKATDYMRMVKALGSVSMFAGGPWSQIAGGAGAVLNAVGTQGRRIFRWFENPEKKSRNEYQRYME